jgi:hypothetical protein
MKRTLVTGLSLLLLAAISTQAGTVTWDGGGGDTNWNTAANWDSGTVPAANDTVIIDNAGTVNVDVNLASGLDVTVSGSSTLNSTSGAREMGAGTTVRIESGATLDSSPDRNWRVRNFVFDDGAIGHAGWLSFYVRDVYTPSFTFNLGATDFTTMTARRMLAWNNYTTDMPAATFAVDFANYTGGVGTIDLIDFQNTNMTDAHLQLSTHIFLNDARYTANLSFDETNDIIQVNVTAVVPSGTVVSIK